MDSETRKLGAVLTTKNARSLYESALAISGIGNRGCAAALFVLCAEECAKAITLGFENKWQTESDIKSLFRDHKYKHSQAVHFSSIVHQLMGLVSEPEQGKPRHGECGVVEYIEDWGVSADESKKKGFYVDFQNGKWNSPSEVSEEILQSSRFQAESLLSVAEAFFGEPEE